MHGPQGRAATPRTPGACHSMGYTYHTGCCITPLPGGVTRFVAWAIPPVISVEPCFDCTHSRDVKSGGFQSNPTRRLPRLPKRRWGPPSIPSPACACVCVRVCCVRVRVRACAFPQLQPLFLPNRVFSLPPPLSTFNQRCALRLLLVRSAAAFASRSLSSGAHHVTRSLHRIRVHAVMLLRCCCCCGAAAYN